MLDAEIKALELGAFVFFGGPTGIGHTRNISPAPPILNANGAIRGGAD